MTTHHNGNGAAHALPDITRVDRAHFVKLARQLRAAQIDRLLLGAANGVARLWRSDVPRAGNQLPSGHRG